tara:strand:+ start:1963 stop:2658 length:696 start_codon:yes stop_codon:yes gene_type:complete
MLTQKIEIAPSILTADFGVLRSQIVEVTTAGVDRIHLDIMDGHFVPPLSFSTEVVTAVASATTLPIEVHLMVENPLKYIEMFSKAGASTHIFHFEAMQNLDSCQTVIQEIKATNSSPAIAISPNTNIDSILELIQDIEQVTVMTIEPGWGGQKLRSELLSKIIDLRRITSEMNLPNFNIEIDGGVKKENIQQCISAGANILVAGSAIYNGNMKPMNAVEELRIAINNSLKK